VNAFCNRPEYILFPNVFAFDQQARQGATGGLLFVEEPLENITRQQPAVNQQLTEFARSGIHVFGSFGKRFGIPVDDLDRFTR
jgi:hypothetical protein